MWDSAEELAEKVVFYLNKDQLRAKMAAAAHRRAVPAYSIPSRATAVLDIIRTELEQRKNEAINPAVWMKN
jgi:spore maturation protein CgeB